MKLIFPLHSVFLALPLEGEARRHFQEVQGKLVPFGDVLRFQNPLSPHMTLNFWEVVTEVEYLKITDTAKRLAMATSPFTLQVQEVGTFGSHGETRVLFLACALSEELLDLTRLCPWPPDTPFHAHVTIARVRDPHAFQRVKGEVLRLLRGVSFPIPIDRLRLYAEVSGKKQTPLEDFIFGKPSSPQPSPRGRG